MERFEKRFFLAPLILILAGAFLSTSCAGQPVREASGSQGDDEGYGRYVLVQDVRPGPGVTERRWLSAYLPNLKNTPGDSPLYVLDSGVPGATLLVVGGTHANEVAGMAAATLLVERAKPVQGRLIVIPHLNSSGLSYTAESNLQPSWIRLDAASGVRYLRYGSRLVYPDHQGQSDPEQYRRPFGGAPLAGEEQRNINRAYPGLTDGPLTQRIAAAVMEVILRENVAIAVDMHEAKPGSSLVWTLVANPKNLDAAVNAVFDLEDLGIRMKLDQSSDQNEGLSHREWGDRTPAQAFLIETVNPAQGIKDGTPVDQLRHDQYPLWKRVGVQLETLSALVRNFNAEGKTGVVQYEGVPGYAELEEKGLEAFF